MVCGQGQTCHPPYIPQKEEPELMYKLFDGITTNLGELKGYD
ncbi:hypothetical protein HMPREF9141_2643 [Prevotella multiformis DSM 16608]|uniref:Uncharacterized protein n=1 Tax=Prevotella multiformis DSM 16608 TaxID=888743 RepID=F0FAM6_9BACT|nr:hypothetical protein HMPREF9141_2643 [Prevotella multiformis DSM 16608]